MIRVSAALRKSVHRANQALVESGLVTETFGNVSGVDRAAGLFVIKPSGVPYEELTPAHMVPVSLETGRVLAGDLRDRALALPIRHGVRPGAAGGPLPGHDARRLLPRRRARDAPADSRGSRARV